jgi:ABC-type antimicrobial peptide transport system permease subunit
MAVGAERNVILWMVIRRILALAGVGVLIGTFCALALTRVLSKFLFEVSATDPAIFAGVAGVLILVALISGWVPALRAVRIYPLDALRHE